MYRSLFIALLLAFPAVATAQSNTASPAAVTVDSAGWLAIGGVSIIQLRDKSVCNSLSDRSSRIMSRMVNALERIHKKDRFHNITVAVLPPRPGEPLGEPWIAVEGELVMKVTYEDAAANDQKPDKLAAAYADQFRKALRRIYTP